MTVRELWQVLNTDEYTFINDMNDDYEIIRGYESGSFAAIRKYFDKTVKSITPGVNSVEIRYI